jgi:hypothetical protein
MLAATLALGIDPQPTPAGARPGVAAGQQAPAAASNLDGTWIIMCATKDGQKLGNSHNETVTIHGNVLTWQNEGKEHRVHLQLGANHGLTAWPEKAEHAAKTEAKNAEHQQSGTADRSAQAPAKEQKTPGPNFVLPLQIPGQLPGATFARAAEAGQREAAEHQAQQHQAGQPGGSHNGVFIETNDFLCLALDQGFEGEMHQQQAASPAKPGTPATPATVKQPAEQAKTPTANQGTNPQAANAKPAQPANTPQGTASTTQAKNENAGHAVETRTASYSGGNMEQKGFVLILRRESGQHQPNQGK